MAAQVKIKILHVRSKYAPGGGPEKVILSLVKKMDTPTLVHSVALLRGPGQCDQRSLLETDAGLGERLYYVPWMKRRLLVDGVIRLRTLLGAQKVQLIHCHDTRANLLGRLAASGARIPLVTTLHGWAEASHFYGWAEDSFWHRLYTAIDRTLIRSFDRVIATSHAVRGIALTAGVDPARLATIPNGMDLSSVREQGDTKAIRQQFGILEGDRLIVTVGRVSPEKGHQYLLEAARWVLDRNPSVRFLIAGEGPSRSMLEERARNLRLNGRIIFAGFRHDIGSIHAASDLFVLPSLTESIPVALLEAMAHGKAVVATDVGGVREVVVDGVTGVLVPPRDSLQLSQAINGLLTDQQRLTAMGQAGMSIVFDRFSDTLMVKRTQEVYQGLLWDGRRPLRER